MFASSLSGWLHSELIELDYLVTNLY